jgi:hypothetical protein
MTPEQANELGHAVTERGVVDEQGVVDSVAVLREPDLHMNIGQCYACKGRHDNIPLHEYRTISPPYTHWYTCPKTNDPVPCTFLVRNGVNLQVNEDILTKLAQAQQTGKYLVIIAREEDNKIHYERIAENMHSKWFMNIAKQTADDMEKSSGPPPAAEMPQAAAMKPISNPFQQ